MADDEFDIDIYGDTNGEQDQVGSFIKDDEGDVKIDGLESAIADSEGDNGAETNGIHPADEKDDEYVDIKIGNEPDKMNGQQQIKSTDDSGRDALNIPKQAPQQQGVKRKEGSDDRPIDPGATTALMISELHWWNTDDDVRGWVNQAMVEDELKEITFSEHKVNGKSKGQAYVEFTSQQAATAAKRKIDAFGAGQQYVKKQTVTYSNPNVNPFRTLPKDAPARAPKENTRGGSSDYSNNRGGGNFSGNFRGRAGYNANRGGMNNNMNNNNNNFNRNISGHGMGNMGGGFNPFPTNPMAGQFGGGYNRGGMMGSMRGVPGGMRGGRGGMGNGMMGGMPMGGMPMGGMPMGGMAGGMGGIPMNMAQMGGGMPGPGGFQGMQPHFNPAFFPQNQAGGGDWQNPHGAKRPRPE